MPNKIAAVIYIISFISAMANIGFAIYHGIKMMNNVKSDKHTLANIAAPFILLMPNLFTDKGNYHRKKSAKFILVAVTCILLMFVIDNYMTEKLLK